jgi:hypothetical protein
LFFLDNFIILTRSNLATVFLPFLPLVVHEITFLEILQAFPSFLSAFPLHFERLIVFLTLLQVALRVVPFKETFEHLAIPVALALGLPSSNDSTWSERTVNKHKTKQVRAKIFIFIIKK